MKKIITFTLIGIFINSYSQFKIDIEAPEDFTAKEVYIYTLDGSKDVFNLKQNKKGNSWNINIAKPYTGMMKAYFPETGSSASFISVNQDVKFSLIIKNDKIYDVDIQDKANKVMNAAQDILQKKEYILPVLYQIGEYYKNDSEFGNALNKEIKNLTTNNPDIAEYPFIEYYVNNYDKYLGKNEKKNSTEDLSNFIIKSNEWLETSALMRPILIAHLNSGPAEKVTQRVDALLSDADIETSRGQNVLSELVEIFNAYGMEDLKNKYLAQADNLKCTINEKLSSTIKNYKNTEIGAKLQNYKFINPSNTKAKDVYGVKADKKIIMFWASTCSHCEKEIPELLEKYSDMKKQNIEIIGFSLDTDKTSYENKRKDLPWIVDSELQGWYSTYSDMYNVHATPSYFILDADNTILDIPIHASNVLEFLKLK
ncbi:MAG: TlpA family protein disulfide reductase [Flavobacteriaceae bacterium]|jgi:peroxiredoxin|nr:TlpA family protein disulfide reductase [Flavobacteriaceae bacterium]